MNIIFTNYGVGALNGLSGDSRLVLDLAGHIALAFGLHKAEFTKDHAQWLKENPDGVVVGINARTNDNRERFFSISIDNTPGKRLTTANTYDLIIQPTFNIKFLDDNVISVDTLPSRITPEAVRSAAAEFISQHKNIVAPVTTVIVSDPLRTKNFMRSMRRIRDFHQKYGGTLLVSTSPKTMPHIADFIKRIVSGLNHHLYIFDEYERAPRKPNPYLAFFGLADRVVVTSDSLSVTSDAVSTGKPVFSIGLKWTDRRHLLLNNYTISACQLANKLGISIIPKAPKQVRYILAYSLAKAGRLKPFSTRSFRQSFYPSPLTNDWQKAGEEIVKAIRKKFDIPHNDQSRQSLSL